MYDYHMHTTFSNGKNTIIEMIDMSKKLGLITIAITDHIWKSSKWFNEYSQFIKKENEKKDINVLIGFEAKALSINGNIDATLDMCLNADIKIGAIHRIPSGKDDEIYLSRDEIKNNKTKAYENWLNTTKSMIINNLVDIVAHPCMVLDKYILDYKNKDIYGLFVLAKKYNKKLEISSRYKKANKALFEILEENPSFLNCVSYGSDAHSVNDLKKAQE